MPPYLYTGRIVIEKKSMGWTRSKIGSYCACSTRMVHEGGHNTRWGELTTKSWDTCRFLYLLLCCVIYKTMLLAVHVQKRIFLVEIMARCIIDAAVYVQCKGLVLLWSTRSSARPVQGESFRHGSGYMYMWTRLSLLSCCFSAYVRTETHAHSFSNQGLAYSEFYML